MQDPEHFGFDEIIQRKEIEGVSLRKLGLGFHFLMNKLIKNDNKYELNITRLKSGPLGGDQSGSNAVTRRLLTYAYESNCESDLYWSNLDLTFNADLDNYWGEEGDAGSLQ